jgi:hypothetical protein
MKYGLGDSLADYGFSFLEKLHSPIFLFHKSGTVKKMNEAGRKLMHIANMSQRQIEDMAKLLKMGHPLQPATDHLRLETGRKYIKVISQRLESSDYFLVELIR